MNRRNRHQPPTTTKVVASHAPVGRAVHARPLIRRIFKSSVSTCLLAAIVFTLFFLWLTKAGRLHLYSPITYWGDALEMASYLGRDYIFNDLRERFCAPFGIDHASSLRYALNFAFQPNSNLFWVCYWITGQIIASLNLYYLLTFPLVFISAYSIYGRLGLSDPFRFGAASLYALMPFHFQRGESHLMESSYFLVPLLTYIVILVFAARPYFHAWVQGKWRFSWKNKRDWFFLGVIVFLSSLNEYHQFFFLILFAIASLASSLRHRNLRILLGAAVMLAAAGLSIFLKMRLTRMISEPGLALSSIGMPIAGYGDAERYGLKMVQIVLPVNGHQLEWMRHITQTYNASHEINENLTVALGLFGAVGFTYLICRGVYRIVSRKSGGAILDHFAFLNLCCVVIATIGGAASVIATAGVLIFGPESLLTQVRCYNRIIVFIGFFCYYGCSVLLMRLTFMAFARVRSRFLKNAFLAGTSVLIFTFAIWDQVPFVLRNDPDGTARYASDRDFFSRIEGELPRTARIFQYPLNIHHANVSSAGRSPYNYTDGIRPYLNSDKLRFTYGGDNGSAQVTWLRETAALPPQRIVERLCESGFSGILIHRKLLEDTKHLTEFEERLAAVVGAPLQESPDKDFSFARLDGFCASNGMPKAEMPMKRNDLISDAQPLGSVSGSSGRENAFRGASTAKIAP